jgi:hypothetical protein
MSSVQQATLVSLEVLEFAEREFPELLFHPDFRMDALQELAMCELGEPLQGEEKREVAHRALSWLRYELGLVLDRPAYPRVDFLWLKEAVTGTLIREADLLGAAA